jgi:uncharacterized protein
MKPLIIYHANCLDGWCAAWVCWNAFGRDIEAVPANYSEPPPDVTGRDVVIVDFSYPRKVLLEMKAKAASLGVVDHHKTAQQDLSGLPFCVFDMARSGAQIAWDNFIGGERPALVEYTADRDLWRWQFPDSRELNAWLRCQPRQFDVWDRLDEELKGWADQKLAVHFGRGVIAGVDEYVEQLKKNARVVDFLGHRVAVVNAPGPNASELLGALAEQDDIAFGLGYFQRADGLWQYSLRSRKSGVDVSAIAKRFGGGGHPQAAGFESGDPPRVEHGEMTIWTHLVSYVAGPFRQDHSALRDAVAKAKESVK